jgi:hypothetical protein
MSIFKREALWMMFYPLIFILIAIAAALLVSKILFWLRL